ncbi:MAG TPA: peptidase T, partial [Saprospiraceae bacterium]|nr:peptidase T [Saprospiraceae bacterium]
MEFPKLKYTATERFLKYVTIDTQSDPNSPTIPSTEKQKNLGKVLVAELLDLGINDAHMDDYGYVYATVPSNVEHDVPVICFCSHMDTSPDCSGTDVKPIIHHNFDGSRIVLPLDEKQVITIAEHPALADQIGNDIITASGDTLLGADNKAGVAEIMDAVYQMVHNPTIQHGTVRILF